MSLKPYYQDSAVTIYHGDCREILPQLPKVDLVLTDPPYGIEYIHSGKCNGRWHRINTQPIVGDSEPFDPSILLSFREIIMWGADHYAAKLPEGRWYVWDKLGGRDSFGDSFGDAEFAWHNRKGASRIFRYMYKGICVEGGKAPKRFHPSQKPLPLMLWCISLSDAPGTILDPFMGSGTTLRAAKDLGRKAIGIEIEERYCEIAAKRMAQEVFAL